MKSEREKKWLGNQIQSARRGLENLPDWAKKSARFEGSDSRSFVAVGNRDSGSKKP